MYAFCDKGTVRQNNEDNFVINETMKAKSLDSFEQQTVSELPCSAGVFDGMGGTSNGEDASYECAYTACVLPRLATAFDDVQRDMQSFYAYANERLLDKQRNTNVKLGSTASCAVLTEDEIILSNVGDSPIFLITGEEIKQISVDDNQAQMLVAMNVITPEQAKTHPMKNQLTQYMGMGLEEDEPFPEPHLYRLNRKTESVDWIILCSDGVSGVLDKNMIKQIVKSDAQNPAKALVMHALDCGSKDNATAVVIKVSCM